MDKLIVHQPSYYCPTFTDENAEVTFSASAQYGRVPKGSQVEVKCKGDEQNVTNATCVAPHWTTVTKCSPAQKLLLFGGYAVSVQSSIEIFHLRDPTKNQEETTTMVPGRYSNTAGLIGDKVMIAGGYGNSAYLKSATIYDPATKTFNTAPDMSYQRYASASAVLDGVFHICGGMASGAGKVCEKYTGGVWEIITQMTTARKFHCLAALNGKLYAVGGESVTSMEAYNPASQTWTMSAAVVPPPTQRGGAATVGGHIYKCGGYFYTTEKPRFLPGQNHPQVPLENTPELRDVLLHGGNAVDASIASLFCAGVVDSRSTGLGGGHFMTIYMKEIGKCIVLDAREGAPAAATQIMFQNHSSTIGWKSIAVPGQLHGLWQAFKSFGSGNISWKELVQPSADLAAKGFPVSWFSAFSLNFTREHIINETTMQIFTNPETGKFYQEGEIIRNPALAETLQKLADSNDPVQLFYDGSIADEIVKEFEENDAVITKEDLNGYRSLERKEIIETKLENGLTLCGPPPPSSAAIVQAILNIMSGYSYDLTSIDGNVSFYHRLIESMKFAYAERSKLGDSNFEPDALKIAKQVSSDTHAEWVRSKIDHGPHDMDFYGGEFGAQEDYGTTHVNVIDSDGNAVAVTSTINMMFGSKRMSQATGILWNNEMDDFSTPGQSNTYGFPPSPTNFIEPGKRPQSSMSPTIVYDQSKNVKMVIGATGGSRIISAVAYTVIRSLWFNETIKEAIDAPRLHNQLRPNNTFYDDGFPKEYIEQLSKKGHNMTAERFPISNVMAVVKSFDNILFANSDYRRGPSVFPAGF